MIRSILFLIVLCALTKDFFALMIHRLPKNENSCGIPKTSKGFILQGQSFSRGSFPWIVALMNTRSSPPRFFCGATIISKAFVVSAAHCIHQKQESEKMLPRDILASFGAHNLSDYTEAGRFQLSPIKIHLHDDWNPRTTEYDADISLLEFEAESIHFNRFVQPICLWDPENEPAVTEGVVAGWGKGEDETKDHENIPKLVKALIQTNEDCFFTDGQKEHVYVSSRRTFCAGLRNGSGICQGDSGGGLFIKVDGVHYLKGIVSSSPVNADDSCDVSINAIYTNVLMFDYWIIDTTAKAARKMFCFFATNWGLNTCKVNQTIDTEDFVIKSLKNTSIDKFDAMNNKKIRYLPRNIGVKFPNLKLFWASHCGLTIVREFYFKNMGKLELFDLTSNQIKKIEPKAFDDLVRLRMFYLTNNLIETLDENLFVNMEYLQMFSLKNNKIKFLSPIMIRHIGNLAPEVADFSLNVCIDRAYSEHRKNLDQLESDLRTHCLQ